MADGSKIEWTDSTWNPITGCSVVSPGCTNCYAMRLAGTRLMHHWSRVGLTEHSKAGPVWNGQVRFNEDWIDQPLHWTRPRMVFVCAHGDLFHENVPDEWIDRVFAAMALAPQHNFQVLTKRPERMRQYLTRPGRGHDGQWIESPGMGARDGIRREMVRMGLYEGLDDWPLPNVWLGTSAEDQTRWDERIMSMLKLAVAGWITWVSAEPLLGPIDMSYLREIDAGGGIDRGIEWVVVGGESGPGSRPMNPAWVRHIAGQCQAADVPFFFKQHGDWATLENDPGKVEAHPWGDGTVAYRIGKKSAGRQLDGLKYSQYPDTDIPW